MKVYPNPFKDTITIESEKNSEGQKELYIFDIKGRRMLMTPLDTSNMHKLDLSHLENGSYLMILDHTTTLDHVKIVKE